MIPRDVARLFSGPVRQRGAGYYAAGRVELVDVAPGVVTAQVAGSRRYEVVISTAGQDDEAVDFDCSCPFFPGHGYCKHVWATLLALDATHPRSARRGPLVPPRAPPWARILESLASEPGRRPTEPTTWPPNRRINYVVDLTQSQVRSGLVVELATQAADRNGGWKPAKRFAYSRERWLAAPDPIDREIAARLLAARPGWSPAPAQQPAAFVIDPAGFDSVLRRMCETGRCKLRRSYGETDPPPLTWDNGDPWELRVRLVAGKKEIAVTAVLQRPGGVEASLTGVDLIQGGLVIRDGQLARADDFDASPLAAVLRDQPLRVPRANAGDLLQALYALPSLPPILGGAELGVREVGPTPRPGAAIRIVPGSPWGGPERAAVELTFDYDGVILPFGPDRPPHFDPARLLLVHRDAGAERAAAGVLEAAGARWQVDYQTRAKRLLLTLSRLDAAIATLLDAGWPVTFKDRQLRRAVRFDLDVRSGIDWFDVTATMDFGGVTLSLPELLAGLAGGSGNFTLPDGSLGLVPAEWRERCAALTQAAQATNQRLRFKPSQVALLDALLATMPGVRTDRVFAQARDRLRRFDGVRPARAPRGFTGELRPYQSQGLGWLHFLRDFGFGGCLADDMGLGKTVQVLALLEARRAAGSGPSLAVVPRSLITNWIREAARFTPKLRVAGHSGGGRSRNGTDPASFDLLLTTYGLLRREAHRLRKVEFDYVILDEAQAIKNARTASAKAARLLNGRHRLALTGTPVENRLSDLWSLFEFLNPGMLGTGMLRTLTRTGAAADGGSRELLARAVRPFILRRTKAQVAPELPERLEQTLYVDLEPAQRRRYDELRDHYRASLIDRIDRLGVRRSRMQILEALLRLRQAACHPGLLDRRRTGEQGGKLEVLLARLAEVAAEGHQALVFSQFTSFLAIVKAHLDQAGVTYEYLDGRTRDRQARVDRFQTDPACTAFLISLKAGGLGLNLTAAGYVFLLDPWWNPAVEAQAIDRAHRIGQTRRVFASRLIARDTVEEKVLELQRSKRKLAEAIIAEDTSVIAGIGREDLELLLS